MTALLFTLTAAPSLAGTLEPREKGAVETGGIPGMIGPDDRAMLDTTEWPWIAIGRLNREAGGFCTGTLVGPDLVLTAAHCLNDQRTGRRVSPETVHFLAGYRRGEWLSHRSAREFLDPAEVAGERGQGANGDRSQAHSSPGIAAADWVLIVLERPADVRPVPVDPVPKGDGAELTVSRAGYGRDRPHLLSLHADCSIAGRSAEGLRLVHTCDATYGDSGSPLLARTARGWSVVGIATGAGKVDARNMGIGVAADAFLPTVRARNEGQSRGRHAPETPLSP